MIGSIIGLRGRKYNEYQVDWVLLCYALHLASAMLLQSEKKEKQIILFTHDKQLATGAIAMGIETMGVR